jgi:phosphoglycolate phosphatase-like HAD superfamily hydrolase
LFSGYIFDVEGTLVDSVPSNLFSLQEALEQAGFAIPYATLQLYSGLDGDQTLQLIAPEFKHARRKEILSVQARIYETKYLHRVRAVFETLTRRGGRIALATDCKGPELKHYCLSWTSRNLSRQLRAATMSTRANPTRALSV